MGTALIAMPFFGWLNDKRNVSGQLLLSFGIRCVSAFFFFFVENPKSWTIWVFPIGIIVGSNLEGIASYAFWVKRIPKDVRALMNGYFSAIARTGQLAVSLSSFYVIGKYSIQALFLIVAVGDLTVFICTFFLAGTRVFSTDKVEGAVAREDHRKKSEAKKIKQAERDAKRKGADKTTAPQEVEMQDQAVAGGKDN